MSDRRYRRVNRPARVLGEGGTRETAGMSGRTALGILEYLGHFVVAMIRHWTAPQAWRHPAG
ncbi:hypothetical protein GCM10025331_49260 [Actinoplanes utahensis]|nr:hypothetical protein Aut01nite_56390 [Actinoplanes utahensis]